MNPSRLEIIINNLLDNICKYTDITKEQYEDWLESEVGLTKEEIQHLKEVDCFPEPIE